MKYELSFVPPGCVETDYTVTVNKATFIPHIGEYIILRDKEGEGLQVFRVLYYM